MKLEYIEFNKLNFLQFRTKCFIAKKQRETRTALLNLYVITDLTSASNFALALTDNFDYMILNEDDLKFLVNRGSDVGIYYRVIGGYMADNANQHIHDQDPFYIVDEILTETSFHSEDLIQKIYNSLHLAYI